MKKKILLIILCTWIPIRISALEYPNLNSKVIEIYDFNDQKILYEKNAKDVISIASLTKIATTITAIENIENLEEEVIITPEILRTVDVEASTAGLRAGDRLTYKDLLYASMLPSGADATNALAIQSSGSIENFVSKMNDLVKRIGLENTHFINVTGLDNENHYSTADEIRKLLEYALKNPLFQKIYTTREYTMTNGKTLKTNLYTYSKNMDIDLSPIQGSKSGFTNQAGYCLSTLSNINGHQIIVLVLNAPKIGTNYYNISDSIDLIHFLNQNYKEETLVSEGKLITNIPIKFSEEETYPIYAQENIKKYLPSDYDINNLKIEYHGLNKLSYKNQKGEKIGTIIYSYKDEVIKNEEVILKSEIKLSIQKIIQKYGIYLIPILFVVISITIIIIHHLRKKKRTSKKRKH